MLHPGDGAAVDPFLDGDVAHGGVRRRPVPVLLAGRASDDLAGADFLNRAAFALHPAAAEGDDQRLSGRMGVSGGADARLEGDMATAGRAGVFRGKERIDADCPREPLGRALHRDISAQPVIFIGYPFSF